MNMDGETDETDEERAMRYTALQMCPEQGF